MRKLKFIVSVVLSVTLIFSLCATSYAEDTTANVMRVEKFSGTVSLTNSNGKNITLKEGLKLYNGYTLTTKSNSDAYLSLDDEKAIKVDANTSVSVSKRGNSFELNLNSGNILFNVKEKLNSNESFNVRTSTMTTGIRGTVGELRVVAKEYTKLNLLEGTVFVTTPELLLKKITAKDVKAGQTALATPLTNESGTSTEDVNLQIIEIDLDSVGGFVRTEVKSDQVLYKRLVEGIGQENTDKLIEDTDAVLAKEKEEAEKSDDQIKKDTSNQEENIIVENPTGGGGGGGGGAVTPTNPFYEITVQSLNAMTEAERVAKINNSLAQSKPVKIIGQASDTPVELTSSVTVPIGKSLILDNCTFNFSNSGTNLTLSGASSSLDLTNNAVVDIKSGASLKMEAGSECNVDATSKIINESSDTVYINDGSKLNLELGAKIEQTETGKIVLGNATQFVELFGSVSFTDSNNSEGSISLADGSGKIVIKGIELDASSVTNIANNPIKISGKEVSLVNSSILSAPSGVTPVKVENGGIFKIEGATSLIESNSAVAIDASGSTLTLYDGNISSTNATAISLNSSSITSDGIKITSTGAASKNIDMQGTSPSVTIQNAQLTSNGTNIDMQGTTPSVTIESSEVTSDGLSISINMPVSGSNLQINDSTVKSTGNEQAVSVGTGATYGMNDNTLVYSKYVNGSATNQPVAGVADLKNIKYGTDKVAANKNSIFFDKLTTGKFEFMEALPINDVDPITIPSGSTLEIGFIDVLGDNITTDGTSELKVDGDLTLTGVVNTALGGNRLVNVSSGGKLTLNGANITSQPADPTSFVSPLKIESGANIVIKDGTIDVSLDETEITTLEKLMNSTFIENNGSLSFDTDSKGLFCHKAPDGNCKLEIITLDNTTYNTDFINGTGTTYEISYYDFLGKVFTMDTLIESKIGNKCYIAGNPFNYSNPKAASTSPNTLVLVNTSTSPKLFTVSGDLNLINLNSSILGVGLFNFNGGTIYVDEIHLLPEP